jgi:glycosyltransferase involved in cell wall biosynthesis
MALDLADGLRPDVDVRFALVGGDAPPGAFGGRLDPELQVDPRELAAGAYDLVHTHLFTPGALGACRSLVRWRTPWVHTVHYEGYAGLRLSRVRRAIDRFLVYPRCDALVAVSAHLYRRLPAAAPRVLIENAVEMTPAPGAAGGAPPQTVGQRGPMRLGTVAMLRREKGIEDLVDAMHVLVHQHGLGPGELTLTIAGDGPLRAMLERRVRRRDLSASVHFRGFVDDLDAFYAGLDLYVQPSRHEGFGLACLEALRHRLPVVATAVGGHPEFLRHGQGGVLVEPQEAIGGRGLARGIRTVMEDRAGWAHRAEEARRVAARRYDPRRRVAEHLALYRRLLAPRVVMVAPVVTHASGGIARQIWTQTRALDRLGLRTALVQRPDPRRREEAFDHARWRHVEILEAGPVYRHGGGAGAVRTRLAGLGFVAAAWARLVREARASVVFHAHQLYSPSLAAGLASIVSGVPVVTKVTSTGALGEPAQLRTMAFSGLRRRLLLRGVAAVVALNPAMRDELRAYGFTPERIHLIPNAVQLPPDPPDPERLRTFAAPGPVRILWVGRIAAEKRLDLAIEAAGHLAGHGYDVELELVGAVDPARDPGEALDRAEARARARTRAARGGRLRVMRHGHIDGVGAFYRRADIFLLPSDTEGLSNALLEAMAHGCVVVASDIPGNRFALVEAAPGAAAGILVPTQDGRAYGARLLDVVRDRERGGERSVACARRAREVAAEAFSDDAVARRLMALYRRLCPGRGI